MSHRKAPNEISDSADGLSVVAFAHPADSRTVDEWARWAGITARTLSRRFPHETGLTFTEWRHRARLMRALERLAEGDAVTTVALDLGYSSVSGFIALFRRAFGVTPAAHPLRRIPIPRS